MPPWWRKESPREWSFSSWNGPDLGARDRGRAAVPEGFIPTLVDLVGTGPVLLGAYTVAELTAVDAIVDFLETRPSDEVLGEAIRSLAARQLLVAGAAPGQVEVRGDLGIAVAFQQRARMVLDARATGTEPGEPWRILLLPQPEQICLLIRIDALGVHQIGLYQRSDALDLLANWLPRGQEVGSHRDDDPEQTLSRAERSALVTVTRYTADGSAEIAGDSTDLILARREAAPRLHPRSSRPQPPDPRRSDRPRPPSLPGQLAHLTQNEVATNL